MPKRRRGVLVVVPLTGSTVRAGAPAGYQRGTRDGVGDDLAWQVVHGLHEVGGDDLLRIALGDDRAVAHRDEMRRIAGGVVEVVEDRDEGGATAVQIREQLHQLDLVRDVEEGRRLVEQQVLRLLGECHRDPDTLPLAARELVDQPAGQLRDPGRDHRLRDSRFVGAAPRPHRALVREPPTPDEVGDGDPVGGDGGLGEEPESASGVLRFRRADVRPVEEDGAGGRAQEPCESAEQGRLAAGVRSDDDRERVVRHLERQLGDDRSIAVAQGEVAGEERRGHGSSFHVRRTNWAASRQVR
ncbi:hypothetical protein SRABI02_00536 [Plantibacter cousiniae]|nr:hypothetical protein SRABI02_00536 [Plantibacter cousiniae]